LNDFKLVNDSYGHVVGDKLLREVATRLKERLRKGDMVFRLGGDEFLVLLEDIKSRDDARNVVDKLLACLSQPLVTDIGILRPDASIGLACYPDDATQVDALLAYADQDMYVLKRQRHRPLVQRFP
ncbi:MAG: GGDEF domain-containing protein, partial [Pusillimonas sp.]|nr:GGDEF domain-containing protein [Pusillimonas sp.]